MAKLYITRRRSLIQSKPNQVKTAKALGLTRMHKTVIKNDTPTIRGMIKVVSHLVDVVEK
ncbi:MAG: 50S ribosomal protein L30 [Candidatus Izimaplasma bacterium HR2]|nr:MAG: 50S ribosomal protein L30 [Candidatus Izimaplasma bacterium HR2]